MLYILILVCAYLIGSIPFGILITRITGRGDLRKVGSGNIGATNVMRVGGLKLAALTWLLDMAKAIVSVLIGRAIGGDVVAAWAGFAAVFGHCFPVWIGFRGGKGISCLFGMFLALNPLMFLFCGIIWLIVALSIGYSSLGAISVMCVAPLFGFAMSYDIGMAMLITCLFCLWRHRQNIGRLVNGTESKIEWKWKK